MPYGAYCFGGLWLFTFGLPRDCVFAWLLFCVTLWLLFDLLVFWGDVSI